MKEKKKICGNCTYFGENGVCRKTGKDVGFFQPGKEKCFEPAEERKAPEPQETGAPRSETVKVCDSCGRELPLSAFGRHARAKDGLQRACMDCASGKRKKPGTKKPVRVKEGWVHEVYHQHPASPSDRLKSFTDKQLFDELVRRGFRGKMERAETLSSDGQDKIEY